MTDQRLRRFSVTLFVVIIISLPATSIAEFACQDISQENTFPGKSWKQAWKDETSYEVIVRRSEGNRVSYHIIGDILRINKRDFASLVRDTYESQPDIHQIVFDAREIHLEAPLSFRTATVKLLAKTIYLEKGGKIALTGPPPSNDKKEGAGDGIVLLGETIQFSSASPMPFAIIPRASGGRSRTLRISARELIDEKGVIPPSRSLAWLNTKILGVALHQSDPAAVEISLSDRGYGNFLQEFRSQMIWPIKYTTKLMTFFARDSFNNDLRTVLSEQISADGDLIAQHPAKSTTLVVERIKHLLKTDHDAFGYGRNQVPRIDIQEMAADLVMDAQRLGPASTYMAALNKTILSAYDQQLPDQASLEDANKTIADQKQAIETRENEITRGMLELGQLAQESDANLSSIRQSDSRLKERLEQIKREDEALAQSRAVGKAISFGAALFPGYGTAISIGVGIAADVMYRPSSQSALNAVDVLTIIQKNTEFSLKVQSLKDKWGDVTQKRESMVNLKIPEGKTEEEAREMANKAFLGSTKEFLGEAAGLKSEFAQEKSTRVSLNELEENDPELQRLLGEQAKIVRKQNELLRYVEQGKLFIDAANTEIGTKEQLIKTLLSKPVVNDRAIANWSQDALSVRRETLESLYRKAMVLRRGIYLLLGKDVLSDKANYFPDLGLYYLGASGDLNRIFDKKWLEDRLLEEGNQFQHSIVTLQDEAQSAMNRFKASRKGVRDYRRLRILRGGGDKESPDAGFMTVVNGLIARQILMDRPTEILVPLYEDNQIMPRNLQVSEGFVDAIVNAKLADPSMLRQKTLAFDIIHSGYGRIWRQQKAFCIDFREKGQSQTGSTRGTLLSEQDFVDGRSRVTWDLTNRLSTDDLKYYTLEPLEGRYFLRIKVSGNRDSPDFKKIPVVLELDVTLISLEY